VIVFDGVSVTYDGADAPVLRDIDISIDEGELCVVVGPTGCGKTTLLRTVNGLVPHFTGGTVEGRVVVDGRATADHRPRDLADVVGFVVQDPTSGFVASEVEEELAYSMESLGLAADVMRRRVEETLDLLGLTALRGRALASLSGGEAQRVAIGAALTANPRVLVLDEPTSALDPGAAEDVLAAVHRLVHDLGITVLMAEHRLERVVSYADRVLTLDHGTAIVGDPAERLATSPLAPPVVRLGRAVGWSPVPTSVRDARRLATDLRAEIASVPAHRPGSTGEPRSRALVLDARDLVVRRGSTAAIVGVDFAVRDGDQVALMGRNGSGKSSLLWALQGSHERASGSVDVGGVDPQSLPAPERRRRVGLVPQEPADLLYLDTVGAECRQADAECMAEPGTCRGLLDRFVTGVDDAIHPRDLSEGQRLALVLAIVLTSTPEVILLDEPTRGLDHVAKGELAAVLAELVATDGCAVVVATHDVEFAAEFSDRVVVLAEGEIVTDGPSLEVLSASPMFAPQVAKVMAPLSLLTVDGVIAARSLCGGASP